MRRRNTGMSFLACVADRHDQLSPPRAAAAVTAVTISLQTLQQAGARERCRSDSVLDARVPGHRGAPFPACYIGVHPDLSH
jgi:hypothetical protein